MENPTFKTLFWAWKEFPNSRPDIEARLKSGTVFITTKELEKATDEQKAFVAKWGIKTQVGRPAGERGGLTTSVEGLGLPSEKQKQANELAHGIIKLEKQLDGILSEFGREISWAYLRGLKKEEPSGDAQPASPSNASSPAKK